MKNEFPEGFHWGTATASFQIEGATKKDGRGESIWDRFAATPGKILTGETGDPACESYDRYKEDVGLMKQIGLNAYRFSIAWPRVVPDGDGAVNAKGLDYYSRLVDELLKAGIEPFATLYHWDLPQALQDKGGWEKRSTVDAYLRYVETVVDRLGDRVTNWMTHNEPRVVSFAGNEGGRHAPGLCDTRVALAVAHNLLISHGKAVPIIRDRCANAKVGIVLDFSPAYPATDSEADEAASRMHHEKFNLWFLDPISGRGYPQLAAQAYGELMPAIEKGDMEVMTAPVDFLGVNYYSRTIAHDPSGSYTKIINRRNPRNMMLRGWEVYPKALADLLTWIHTDYSFPEIIISENGAMYDDVVWEGEVHDLTRLDYIKQHLSVLPEVIAKGVPLTGYFCWSLMDNFEWAQGTRDRFGLIYVDVETQKRIVKDSGKWFARVAQANAVVD